MAVWLQTATMLAIAAVLGAIGAVSRRALIRWFRFNPTGWLGLVAGLSISVAVAIYYGVPCGCDVYRATTLLIIAFVAFALMWLGALMLGRQHIDLVLILLFCVGALVILVAGATLFFGIAWSAAHGGPQ